MEPSPAPGDVQTDFLISGDSAYAVYRADQNANGLLELFSRPLDGSGTAVKLNTTLPSSADVNNFLISPDGARVVYNADQDAANVNELYSRAIDGSGAPVKVNGT